MSAPAASPRAPRTSVMLSALVHHHDRGQPTRHRVLNLSDTGVRLSSDGELTPGRVVSVSIGEVDHALADVVRFDGNGAGLRFHQEIDLAAARRRRVGAPPAPAAGWLVEVQDPYRS